MRTVASRQSEDAIRSAIGATTRIFDRATERSRAELRIVTELREPRARRGRRLQTKVARDEAGTLAQLVELELDDPLERRGRQRTEREDRVDAAEQLGTEELRSAPVGSGDASGRDENPAGVGSFAPRFVVITITAMRKSIRC